jgi:phloretin hydrolase
MKPDFKREENVQSIEALSELTEEEKANPLAPHYYRKLVDASNEVMLGIQMGKPMDPSRVLFPDHVSDLLKPGYLEVENGYCLLPNGAAYAAVCTKTPDVSPEMFAWWNHWSRDKGSPDFLYKIWYPGKHFRSHLNWVLEDIGNGPEDIYFGAAATPEEKGIANSLLEKAGCTMGGRNFMIKPLNSSLDVRPLPGCLVHVIRMTSQGRERRSRFWFGYQWMNGSVLFNLNGNELTEKQGYNMAMHCAREFANEAELIKLAYQDYFKNGRG